MREGGGKQQRCFYDVVIGGGENETEAWLVDMLKFAESGELTTEGCALPNDAGWQVVWAVLRN